MDIKALKLEARFSLPPNSLGYCGKDSAAEKFKECIIHGKCEEVEEELKHFIVLYPYLETIAGITKLPKFFYEVIESYWIGNELLKKAKAEHYDLLLKNFEKQGVPDFFVEELKQKPPKVFIPNHLFQVLHIGVGKASGSVPFNLKSINNCMIRWGEVVKVQNEKAVINLHSLELQKKSIRPVIASDPAQPESVAISINKDCFVVPPRNDNKKNRLKTKTYKLAFKEETIPFSKKLVPGIKMGDVVAVHWNMVIKILTKQEEKKLKYWTKQCLVLF